MSHFEISVNAAEKVAQLRRFPVLIEKYLTPALDLSAKNINNAARRNVRKNESMGHTHLMDSILNKTSANGLEVIIKAGMNYANFVEFGTSPGYKKIPPIQPIIDWLRVKQISPNHSDMSEKDLGYFIARSIALNGTLANPFMQPAFESEKESTINRLNHAIELALQEIH